MSAPAEPRRTAMPEDDRSGAAMMAGEMESLHDWLEMYRHTLPIKLGGLTAEQLCTASVPPSNLTLLGLVRHLTEVERYWFGAVVAGEALPSVYCAFDRDGDFTGIDPAQAFDDLARYDAEMVASRERAAAISNLDTALPGQRNGEPVNLRWVYTHLIEEYARHMGHVDLVRESLDGATGY